MIDSKGEFMMINKNNLFVDQSYQRKLLDAKAKDYSRKFSWVKFGVVSVIDRGGKYLIVDGQHRHAATMFIKEIQDIPCMVFKGNDLKDEAEAFLGINSNRSVVGAFDKYKALGVCDDVIARNVDKIFVKYDINLALAVSKPRDIKCIASCMLYYKQNPVVFEKTIMLLSEMCYDCPLSRELVAGVFQVILNFNDDKKIIEIMKSIGAHALLRSARDFVLAMNNGSGPIMWAKGMLVVINKRLRNKYII